MLLRRRAVFCAKECDISPNPGAYKLLKLNGLQRRFYAGFVPKGGIALNDASGSCV